MEVLLHHLQIKSTSPKTIPCSQLWIPAGRWYDLAAKTTSFAMRWRMVQEKTWLSSTLCALENAGSQNWQKKSTPVNKKLKILFLATNSASAQPGGSLVLAGRSNPLLRISPSKAHVPFAAGTRFSSLSWHGLWPQLHGTVPVLSETKEVASSPDGILSRELQNLGHSQKKTWTQWSSHPKNKLPRTLNHGGPIHGARLLVASVPYKSSTNS